MENNPLLEALKNEQTATYIVDMVLINPKRFKTDILDLLRLQREESLSEAKKEMDKLSPEILVIEQSILNAKLI